jgi:hypothetical protein
MAATTLSTGSPKLSQKSSSTFVVLDQNDDDNNAAAGARLVGLLLMLTHTHTDLQRYSDSQLHSRLRLTSILSGFTRHWH